MFTLFDIHFLFTGPCRLSGSDSVSDLSQTGSNTNRSKVSSVYSEDMVQGEPPGTPPPPYGYLPADEADENYSVIMDDVSMRK